MNKDNYTEDRNDQKMMMTRKLITHLVCMIFIFSIFQNVSAVDRIYTIEDNNSNVTINSGEKFNVSLKGTGGTPYFWYIRPYDSSILKLVDEGAWAFSDNPGSSYLWNWTFQGKKEGNTTLTFIYSQSSVGDESILRALTLNVTVNAGNSEPILWPLIIIVMFIIVIPTIAIKKWIKGGGDK